MLWRLLASAALASLATACRGTSVPPLPERWRVAHPVDDHELEALLSPDLETQGTELLENGEGERLFVARLRQRVPRGYRDRYVRLLRTRGVFIYPRRDPHIYPWGVSKGPVDGYDFTVVVPGVDAPQAYSLCHRSFQDFDTSDWRSWRPHLHPVEVRGTLVLVRLGNAGKAMSREIWVLPRRDQADAPELPFPRYPGAVIQAVYPGRDLGRTAEWRTRIARRYSVQDAPERVIAYYTRALEVLGGKPTAISLTHGTAIEWRAPFSQTSGFQRVMISAASPPALPLQPSVEGAPELLDRFPRLREVTQLGVLVEFADEREATEWRAYDDQPPRHGESHGSGRLHRDQN